MNECIINKFLSVKLEGKDTVIYVRGKKFMGCSFLLLEVPKNRAKENHGGSIDEMEETFIAEVGKDISLISPALEYWGHCSALEGWADYNYDTRVLHRNLSFPLLKELVKAGDPKANKVFKDEIAKRIAKGFFAVTEYLIVEDYIIYLNNEEFESMINDMNIAGKKMLAQCISSRLKQPGVSHEIKRILFDFLEAVDHEELNKLQYVIFNEEKFFVNEDVLRIYVSRDKSIKNIEQLEGLGKLKTLKRLDINNQLISRISGLEELRDLKELHFRGNKITRIEGLDCLVKLEILNLDDNLITEIEGLKNLENLKCLYLDRNYIDKIKNVGHLKSLERLNLSGNKIKKIEGVRNLSNLRFLNLWDNEIDRN